MKNISPDQQERFNQDRYELLLQLDELLNLPMAVLAFVWLALLVADLVWGLTPTLEALLSTIWIIFIADFLLKFLLAPRKVHFLKANWLTVIALVVPAIRVFRVLGLLRFSRGLALTRVVSSVNRSMRSLRFTMGRRGFGYIAALVSIVALASSSGMYAFERGINPDISSFGSALWLSAIAATIGTDYWPYSPEGRILAFLLGLFSLAVSGYVTAFLASYFIGRDVERDEASGANKRAIDDLRAEVQALRDENRVMMSELKSISEALNKG